MGDDLRDWVQKVLAQPPPAARVPVEQLRLPELPEEEYEIVFSSPTKSWESINFVMVSDSSVSSDFSNTLAAYKTSGYASPKKKAQWKNEPLAYGPQKHKKGS